jgi:thiol-disulfide isomerase/thioredoxin
MRHVIVLCLSLSLAAVAQGGGAPASDSVRVAPPFHGVGWLNTKPLTAKELRGRVMLVEFWTFDCINCRRTMPAMKALQQMYRDSGVVIVGVHTPELDHERDPLAIKRAVEQYGLTYPVLLDLDGDTWTAYKNRYWPTLYVVDRRGVIRDIHIGELHQGTEEWSSLLALIATLRKEAA